MKTALENFPELVSELSRLDRTFASKAEVAASPQFAQMVQDLLDVGAFPSTSETQSFLLAVISCQRGEDVSPELKEFVREGLALGERARELKRMRDDALVVEAERTRLEAACAQALAVLEEQREILISLSNLSETVAGYTPGVRQGFPLAVHVDAFVADRNRRDFAKHLEQVVIPECARQLSDAQQALRDFIESRTAPEPQI